MKQQDLDEKANHSVKWLCCGPQLAALGYAGPGQLHTLATDCAKPWTQELTMLFAGLSLACASDTACGHGPSSGLVWSLLSATM